MLSKNTTILIMIGIVASLIAGGCVLTQSNSTDAATGTYTDGNWTFNVSGNDAIIVSNTATNITALNIPSTVSANGNTYTVKTIGSGTAILTNSHLSSGCTLTIPNTVTVINDGAFTQLSNLSGTLTIPNSVTRIGNSAFNSCSGFTGNLVIPNSVTTIGSTAFQGCYGFNGTLTLSSGLTSIGASAFYLAGFTGNLTIPNSVTSIGQQAFASTEFNGTLTLSDRLTTIYESSFENTPFTGTLTIPHNVTTIESKAFISNAISTIILPTNLTTIASDSFDECESLETIYNASSLNITAGSTDYGSVGFYATNVYKCYTITFVSNNYAYGTVSDEYAYIVSGETLSVSTNTITITTLPKTVTANPISPNMFKNWSNTSGTVNADRTVTANFTRNEFTVELTPGQTWTYTPTSNLPGATFTISGDATSWLTLSGGQITGTAPNVVEITQYTLTITATTTQPSQTEIQEINFTVVPTLTASANPTILYLWTGGPIPNSASETVALTYTGFGTGTYVWSMVDNGGTGVQVAADGTLSGTAGNVTSSPVTVTVRLTGTVNGISQTVDVTFDVVIVAKLVFTSNPYTDAVIS